MNGRRVIILALLLIAPIAAAQEDPTVNDSDFNTTPPAEDESYLGESEPAAEEDPTGDPTLSNSDFDTAAPIMDESYLDADAPAGSDGASAGNQTPASALLVALVGFAAVALALRRKV